MYLFAVKKFIFSILSRKATRSQRNHILIGKIYFYLFISNKSIKFVLKLYFEYLYWLMLYLTMFQLRIYALMVLWLFI